MLNTDFMCFDFSIGVLFLPIGTYACLIYFSYVHSIMNFGIIFWVNSSYSSDMCKIKKKE